MSKSKLIAVLDTGYSFDIKDARNTYFTYPISGKRATPAIQITTTKDETLYYHPDQIIIKRKK